MAAANPATTASLVLHKGVRGQVGAERIALLQAVRDHGSISGAAKAAGLSYKGAWDAVQALNNLFDRPLVTSRAGGRSGGAAVVTSEGEAVIAAFHAAEAELGHVLAALERRLDNPAGAPLKTLLWSLSMKTSARNALRGVVERVTAGAVNVEVEVRISDRARLVAIVTKQSLDDLGIAVGREVIALIKSSFVILARGEGELRTSARNCLAGTIAHREDGAVNSELTLELDEGKTLTATVTRESADALELDVGVSALALIKASHIILAVE